MIFAQTDRDTFTQRKIIHSKATKAAKKKRTVSQMFQIGLKIRVRNQQWAAERLAIVSRSVRSFCGYLAFAALL